ncbi:CDP-glycerol glycerophosphotransferase family protein [Staphylococcus sciuri]|uniref:CDP-glycerol glycerophosphotransferase family protein n=1 Tax=Mammaliicoccus sciuri TaxID=1296 RepID=UPI0018CB8A28|nr:CDP-glycerol glycerophosphotransferase family protein [Mammaliicoccus sciuri]MBG9205654.1 CDP-glycerol glycerophosphotransferase family protein [Mammaliicoccus sciuri]
MSNRKIWVFDATNEFVGNAKWLFLYINKYRNDIDAYWICDNLDAINTIKKMDYKAVLTSSLKATKIKKKAGVFVVNQISDSMCESENNDIVILNLWQKVGLDTNSMRNASKELKHKNYSKYIKLNSIYKNNQLLIATSPFMEKYFIKKLNLDETQIIKSGYPALMYKKDRYDLNELLSEKNYNSETKIALYSPASRDYTDSFSLYNALPDIDILTTNLEKNNILLIIKLNNISNFKLIEEEMKSINKSNKSIVIWDNNKDIYEIFNSIDIGIVDYSSTFYELLESGVTSFIRYIYDYDKYIQRYTLLEDYYENTTGIVAKSYPELIHALNKIRDYDDDKIKINEIKGKFLGYYHNDIEVIINKTLLYKIQDKNISNLYSFDVFDTIIQRKTLKPEGIFYYVKDKLIRSNNEIPKYVIQNYPLIRMQAEKYLRDFYKKSQFIREDNRTEIQFEDIINRIQAVYNLRKSDAQLLYDLEIEAELLNVEKKPGGFDELEYLIQKNEQVVLISDMYLSKNVIKKMLEKVDSNLLNIPLYLSSDIGTQKSTGDMYIEVFEQLNYDYKNWIHYGDNIHADINIPGKMNILTKKQKLNNFNYYENKLIEQNKNYDNYLLSTLLARYRSKDKSSNLNYYIYAYLSSYFIPYVNWSLKKAVEQGIDTLYFISRDGEILKKIADEIIKKNNYDIKTKFIYGSRKAWRIPSFIDQVDDEFYSPFGNFSGINNYKNMLLAMHLSEEEFEQIFPELLYLKNIKKFDFQTKELIRKTAKNNITYNSLLLTKAKNEREIVNRYLKQEINFQENFAFVEYWGRGYTQDCLVRLIESFNNMNKEVVFFYARSIYPSIGKSIRYNYTSNMTSLIFIESIFANIPYKSINGYVEKDRKIVPIIESKNYDKKLFEGINEVFPHFINDFYSLNFIDLDEIERNFYEFGLNYFNNNPEDQLIIEYFAPLKDSVILFEKEIEYAPAISYGMASKKLLGRKVQLNTKNKKMSIKRSPKGVQIIHKLYSNYLKRVFKKIKREKSL